MLRLATTSAFLLALAVGAFAADDHDHDDDHGHDHHVSELGQVRAVHAWTRATSGDSALIFVDIENHSDAVVVLQGGESDFAESAELVGFRLKDGEPSYVVLKSVPIKGGTELVLEPEGLALRLNGLSEPLHEGEEVEIEIEFDAGHMDVFVEVGAATAKAHSHAGHQH